MRSVAAKFSAAGVSTIVGASAFAGVGALAAVAAPSASAAAGCTSPSSGVTVVVQFATGTAIGCAPGAPASALDALRSSGFSTTGTVPYGDTVLCSINGKPFNAVCPVMPPANAYWAISSAKRGGSWVYSTVAVTTLHVPVGGVVGFKFGSGGTPTVAVPAAFPSTSTKAPAAATTKSVAAQAPAKTASKTSAKPAAKVPAAKPASTPTHSNSKASSTSATTSSKASSTSSPTATARTSASTSAAPTTAAPVVKATQTVHEGNATKVVVTYNDGSKATVAPSAASSGQYKVGATKSQQPTSMAKMSTHVPTPSNTSHPSIWTSGSVPVTPATKGGSSNLPGIIAGVGVVGAVAVGGAVVIRRRG